MSSDSINFMEANNNKNPDQTEQSDQISSMKTLSVAKFFSCAIYHQRWMRLDILSSKPHPSVIPGFFAYLFNDNALNVFVVRGLVYLASILPLRKGIILWGNMFLRVILTTTAMIQAELFQGNKIYTVDLSIMLNSFHQLGSAVAQ